MRGIPCPSERVHPHLTSSDKYQHTHALSFILTADVFVVVFFQHFQIVRPGILSRSKTYHGQEAGFTQKEFS